MVYRKICSFLADVDDNVTPPPASTAIRDNREDLFSYDIAHGKGNRQD